MGYAMNETERKDQSAGFVSYIVSWFVGVGVFALLVWVGLWLIQE